ncbi:unnamed protein product, partial [Trichogramma brassicae]
MEVRTRRVLLLGCLVYNLLSTGLPAPLYESFTALSVAARSSARLREGPRIIVPRCNTSFFSNSFIFDAARLWSDLPARLRSAPTLSAFRNLFHHYLNSRT